MKLKDLLYKISENTVIWITDYPAYPECIYCGPAGEMSFHVARKYEVLEISARYFPALEAFGITVIVKTTE